MDKSSAKNAIIQHLATLETVINRVAEDERFEQEHEHTRNQGIRRMNRKRSVWVKLWLQRRPLHGQYEQLMKELHAEDVSGFNNFMRMEPQAFHELLTRIAPRITKQDTNYRKALEAGLKLAITLRFLATGNS